MLHRSIESCNSYTVLRLPRHGDLQTPTFMQAQGCDATVSWFAFTGKRLTKRTEYLIDWYTYCGLAHHRLSHLHIAVCKGLSVRYFHVSLRDMALLGELIKHDGGLFVRFSAGLLQPGKVNLPWERLLAEGAVTL